MLWQKWIVLGLCLATAARADITPVVIDYFYEPGCPDCNRVRDEIMPELRESYEGFYRLNHYDVGITTNVIRLATYQKALNITSNEPVMMVADYRHVFNGFDAIKKGLFSQIDELVAQRMEPGWVPPRVIEVSDAGVVYERLRGFTIAMVMGAGFADGINPCAISTLVFFMSLLGVSGIRGRRLLLMGASFCLATFLTYTALGFGLLRALHLLTGFGWVRFGLEMVMMALLGIFAYLSFRDANRYKISGKTDDVTLQLPDSIKLRIHRVIRHGAWRIGHRQNEQDYQNADSSGAKGNSTRETLCSMLSVAVSGFVVGAAVTALESVCTGQMYVPTMVMVIKSSGGSHLAAGLSAKAWQYLLLYNIMFIVPLVAVFILTYFGLATEKLIAWSKHNVVFSKILLGLFFLAMAVLIVVL